ncbi:atypical/RIO/RIO2 protein kinase [Magnaporthiopsis poae ATCC 64411]|uniref:Serine/threonine-protein kinase RIO2 n=1 Tax=Magnaporthiopsis poae (strain ATCC 64411 / 73-15) TaxID=644358 RepID=A0A0C4DMF4_MAGP6|nr:atypical/RIO/RIO2 protein kinase [Magnaporthiopsis poae ATCC 64411]
MKLDSKAMRHLTSEDWRVLTAVETCSKGHELVPTPMIEKTAHLRGGSSGTRKSISNLAKVGLIARVKEAKYDGYRLTYGGLDYLALHAHSAKRAVYSVGTRIGVGKESDIMIVADETGTQRVLKIHRLGRISFRTVKANRDYLKRTRGGGGGGSWMYLSRLAAMKEYAFMRALRDEGFPVPEPLAQSRHTIVMSLIDAHPLRQIASVPDPAALYAELMVLILRLARHGLIHGDFNEFNILIKEDKVPTAPDSPSPDADGGNGGDEETASRVLLTPIVIDFPQMVSMEHANAEMYFDRDVACIKRFFQRRFHFSSDEPGPFFKDAKKTVGAGGARRLDAAVEASGFTKKMLKDLEAAMQEQLASRGDGEAGANEDDDDDDDEYDEDENSENELQSDDVEEIHQDEGLGEDDGAEKESKLPQKSDATDAVCETLEKATERLAIKEGDGQPSE